MAKHNDEHLADKTSAEVHAAHNSKGLAVSEQCKCDDCASHRADSGPVEKPSKGGFSGFKL